MRLARLIVGGRCVSASVEEDEDLYGPDGARYKPSEVTWLPPVSPTKIVGLVLNYADHANELGLTPSGEPVLMMKPLNTLLGHRGQIVYPREATHMHYEAELAFVVDRQARRIASERAMDFVKGYTIANDVTVRDFITNTFRPPVRAKGFDTFCPLGPYLATKDEVPDMANLNIKTVVNGEPRQQGNTKNFLHAIPKILEFITSFMTLEPDDVILTGTPKGISPIVPGDSVEISIDHLGTLVNNVVAERRE